MSKKKYLVILAFVAVLPALLYGAQFVSAHSGGGTTAHGDTIDMKIREVWVGPTSSSLNRVFNGSSETVTVTANRTDYIRLDFDLISTSVDSIWDNINPFSENWPDIGECVASIQGRIYMDPDRTQRVFTSRSVDSLLNEDGVNDDRYVMSIICNFGEFSYSDPHTVLDGAELIVQAPGGGPGPAPTLTLTANPTSITQGQSTTVSWSSTNTTSCTGSRGGSYPTSGSFVDSPSSTITYGMTCTGSGGSVTRSVTVTVSGVPPPATPIGYHDGVDNGGCRTWGWAYDRSATSTSIAVHIYRDGPAGGGGTVLNSFPTNVFRSDVNSTYGVSGNHGFDVNLSSYIADGSSHPLYIYAIDTEGVSNPLLTNSPRTIQCAAAVGPQPSVDIKGQ